MTAHAHYSKASIGGHPIHPMLVGFPIAFYTAGVAGLLVYAGSHDPFWYRASMISVIAGVVMALVAAVFGLVDLFVGVPSRTPARSTGIKHMILNVVTVVVFAIAAVLMYAAWQGRPEIEAHPQLGFAGPLVLGILGLGITVVSGVLGWKMVQTHHVGIDETSDTVTGDYAHRGGTA